MSFRRRYTLPELFVLLSPPQRRRGGRRWPLQPRAALMHQLVRLAKEGLREYDERLNRLVRHYEDRDHDHDYDDRLRPANLVEERLGEEIESVESRAPEEEADELRCLTRAEIQLIFAALATRRYRLNARGYPYTSDVNEERERVFPWSEPLENDAVRDAWDDWRDQGGKQLFRRESRAPPEGGRRRRAEREESEEFSEALYATLMRALRDLDGRRQHRDEPLKDQADDDEDDDEDEDDGQVSCVAPTESNTSRCQPPSECLFEVFDELALSPAPTSRGFESGDKPDFHEVNLRLVERGEVELQHEDDLRVSWRAYLVAAASARGTHRRDPHEQEAPLQTEIIETETVASVVEFSAGPADGAPFSARRRNTWRST